MASCRILFDNRTHESLLDALIGCQVVSYNLGVSTSITWALIGHMILSPLAAWMKISSPCTLCIDEKRASQFSQWMVMSGSLVHAPQLLVHKIQDVRKNFEPT
jgi:hypothetical protein